MKGIREIENWRAEEIAKVYLLNSGLVTLLPNYTTDKFDFLAIGKDLPDRKIAVEVKATKYPKNEIKKVFGKIRKEYTRLPLPVIVMYIDYDKENGYFEILKKKSEVKHDLQPLQSDTLKQELSGLVN